MRKVVLLAASFLLFAASFATSNINIELPKKVMADKVMIPIGKSGMKISWADLSTIKAKDLQALTGRKMSFVERTTFKAAQAKIRSTIERDGSINSKKMRNILARKGGESGFHLGGFALGFLLGLIGVLVAYLINDDFKRNRVKWAWLGLAIGFVLSLVLILAVFASVA